MSEVWGVSKNTQNHGFWVSERVYGKCWSSGVWIFVKSHIELKCFRMAVCYDKRPLLQSKIYLLKAFQTLWNTLEVPHDQQEHMISNHDAWKRSEINEKLHQGPYSRISHRPSKCMNSSPFWDPSKFTHLTWSANRKFSIGRITIK